MLSHLDSLKGICTKHRLIHSLRNFYGQCEAARTAHYGIHDTTPTTFVVQASCLTKEYSDFVRRFGELSAHLYFQEKLGPKHCAENMWLIKPCGLNQGSRVREQ